jgi:hypothetical protein
MRKEQTRLRSLFSLFIRMQTIMIRKGRLILVHKLRLYAWFLNGKKGKAISVTRRGGPYS